MGPVDILSGFLIEQLGEGHTVMTDKSPLTPATRPDQNMNNSYDVFRIMQNVAGLLGTFHSTSICFTIVSFQKEE